jgi:small subunit ribosomal protein S6
MSRVYEVMFIIRPDVDDDEAEKLITNFSSTVTTGGGVEVQRRQLRAADH